MNCSYGERMTDLSVHSDSSHFTRRHEMRRTPGEETKCLPLSSCVGHFLLLAVSKIARIMVRLCCMSGMQL